MSEDDKTKKEFEDFEKYLSANLRMPENFKLTDTNEEIDEDQRFVEDKDYKNKTRQPEKAIDEKKEIEESLFEIVDEGDEEPAEEDDEIEIEDEIPEINIGEMEEESTSADSYYHNPSEVDGYMDINDEALLYSNETKSSVLFDELNKGTDEDFEDDEEEDDDFAPKPKVKFEDLKNQKKNLSSKLNKSMNLAILGGVFIVLLFSFFIGRGHKEKKAKEKDKPLKTVNLEGYTPDWGDYQARSHKMTAQEEKKEDLEYASRLLNSGKKEFKAEEPAPKKTTYENHNKTQPISSASSEEFINARNSGIRFNGEGFGSNYQSDAAGYSSYENRTGFIGNPYGNATESYLENISNLTKGLGNSDINERKFSNGKSNANKAAGYSNIPPNSLYPGTILPAVLISGINTDYPGQITARITSPVYDSKTGKTLLIPGGSILRGSYSSASVGVSRVQIAWTDLIINRDGYDYIVSLGAMNGVDRKGYSGVNGFLDDHAFSYLKAAGISCLFTLLNENIYTLSNAQKSKIKQTMISDAQDIGNKLADKILDRALDIQPTIYVRSGTKINVDVDKVLTLRPYERDMPKERYVRGAK